jgi:hypothetical protein
MVPDMNRLTFISAAGEINSTVIDVPDINGPVGKMLLTMGTIDQGETFGWLVIVNLPKIKPRIAVAAETRDVKVRS